jgi:hypothetical protein
MMNILFNLHFSLETPNLLHGYTTIGQAAPPDVIPSQPSPAAVWIPGYWNWNGYQYNWIAGFWAIPPVGFRVYVGGEWIFRHGGYYYRRAYWR